MYFQKDSAREFNINKKKSAKPKCELWWKKVVLKCGEKEFKEELQNIN